MSKSRKRPDLRRLQPSRRDFLKLSGAALGCALLGSAYGCGGGGGDDGGGDPLPNGYRFYRIYSPGDLGLFPEVTGLSPQVLLNERGQVFFSGQTAAGDFGFYALTRDLSGTPAIGDARRILLEGTAGPNGRIIDTLTSVDVDDDGTVAGVLAYEMEANTDQSPGSVVTDRGSGLEVLVDYNDELPGNQGAYGGDFGDIDIEGGDVMVVARYGGDGLDAEGLFFLPGAQAAQAKIVVNTGDEIPEANGTLDGLGLVDLDENGAYVLQAFGDDPLRPLSARQSRQSGGVLFQGNVNAPRQQNRLLSACPSLELSRSARARTTVPIVGDNLYGPRIGGAEVTSYVTQIGDDLILFRNDSIIAQSGAQSPGGAVIRTLIPGVVNGGGLTFFQLITEQGIELCANDGVRSALLLQRGDRIDGRQLDTLALGFHNNQADDLGRIVCYCQFADGQEALLLGIPV